MISKKWKRTIRDGVAVTQVEFTFGVDADEKFDEVQRQVNGIRKDLPSDLYQLDVKQMSTNTVSIFQIALVSEKCGLQSVENGSRTSKKDDRAS